MPCTHAAQGVWRACGALAEAEVGPDDDHFAVHRRNERVDEGLGWHREEFRGAAEQDNELHLGDSQQDEPFGLQGEIPVLTPVKHLAGVDVEGHDAWREPVSPCLGERPDQELLVSAVDSVELPDGDHRRPSCTHAVEVVGSGRIAQ